MFCCLDEATQKVWTQGFRHCGLSSRSTEWHKLPARLCGCTKWKRGTSGGETAWVRLEQKAADCEIISWKSGRSCHPAIYSRSCYYTFKIGRIWFNRLGNVIWWLVFSCYPSQWIWRGSARRSSSEYPLGCIDSEESYKWVEAITSNCSMSIIRESYGKK